MQTLNILPRITTSFWKPNTEIKRYMKILKTISFFILLLFSANLQSQTFSACVEGTISVYGDAELSLCQGDGLEDEIRFRTSPLGTPVGYIVVDENDIIVHVSSSSRIDFEEFTYGLGRYSMGDHCIKSDMSTKIKILFEMYDLDGRKEITRLELSV